jgi:hypothetical protein
MELLADSCIRLFFGFLWCGFFRPHIYAFDFHARQFAAMPNRAVVALTTLILERDHLVVLALREHFSRHFCSRDDRIAVRHVFTVGKHQHVTEDRGLAGLDLEKIDVDRVAFRDAKLSAASLDNCVSHERVGEKKPSKIPQMPGLGKRKAWRKRP